MFFKLPCISWCKLHHKVLIYSYWCARHLNGSGGRSGWRWLWISLDPYLRKLPLNLLPRFIIDGVITLPIALYGFLLFPGLPRDNDVFYLRKEVQVLPLEISKITWRTQLGAHPCNSTLTRGCADFTSALVLEIGPEDPESLAMVRV